jgi:hypothetical protein
LNDSSTSREPEPTEKVAKNPKVKNAWETYKKARKQYLDIKAKVSRELMERHKSERDELHKEQKKEQKQLYEISWQGKGAELNQKRSLMAANQQKAKLDLRDRQEKERKKLRSRFPPRFPNFKTWLDEDDKELSALFRYGQNLVLTGEGNPYVPGSTDLRDYTGKSANKGGIAYFLRGKEAKGEADFIDYGRKICLSKDCDEGAILAAFQLATQKWGSVNISGSDEYKAMCVKLAAKHGFKIKNPDLQKAIEEEKAGELNKAEKTLEQQKIIDRYMTDMTQEKQHEGSTNTTKNEQQKQFNQVVTERRELFKQYADAVGADRYRIVATEFTAQGIKAFIFDKQNGGLEGKTRKEILEVMPKLQTYVKYNKNINVVPLSDHKHHIVIDDLTKGKLQQLKEDGYRPSCVIESSPGNFQAILTIPKLGTEKEREAANRLAKELNQQYGDPKLSGAVHAHRLPPFPNLKPKYRDENGTSPETALVEKDGGICQKAGKRLGELQEHINRETERQKQIPVTSTNADDLNGAYWAHYKDIMARSANTTHDYSSIDGKIGIRMRVTGYSAAQVYEAIKNNAPAMRKETMAAAEWDAKYRNRDWSRFAQETVDKFVFGARGANQYGQAESYRPYYLKVEGRNSQQSKAGKAEKDLGR